MGKRKTARPLFPNAGVDAWYRAQLQALVRDMAKDLLSRVRSAWREGGGVAIDERVTAYAAGIIFRTCGRIFLCKRSDGTGWAFPGGGIEPGETSEGAARREVTEELGEVYTGPLTFLHTNVYNGVAFATFIADLPDPFAIDPVLNSEHTACRWAGVGEALSMHLHPGVRRTLTELWRNLLAQDARPKNTTPKLLQLALQRWGGLWSRKMDKTADKIALQFAMKSRAATTAGMMKQLADAGFTVKFKPSKAARAAFDATVAANVGLIKSIPQKLLGDVQNVVWQGVMNGADLSTVADQIQEKYGIAHRRAALIARDQNHKAKAAMERANRLSVGISQADWQHSHAGKDARPTHVEMDGERYDIATGMWDSAVQKYVWPGTEIHCRCSDRPVIPGFE